MVTKCRQRPLKPIVVFLQILVLNKIMVFLIDTVVCELIKEVCLYVSHRIWFTGKPHQPFLINIKSERLVRCHANINPKIELMSIDKEWVRNVPLNNGLIFVNIHLRYVIYNIYASSPWQIARFHDPKVLCTVVVAVRVLHLHLVLFEHLHEIAILVREHKCFWYEIPRFLTVSILHFADVNTQSVFSRDFITLRKMVYLLILIQALVKITFTRAAAPKNVPLMGFCVHKVIGFKYGPY